MQIFLTGAAVLSYSFQEDGFYDSFSAKEWVELDRSVKLPELESMTVCTWVKMHFHRLHNQIWSYCALKNSFLVCSGLSNFFLNAYFC